MKPLRPSAKAIIIRDGALLVLRMRDEVGPWYLLPGGGVDFGETLHDALHRECREEIGCDVEVGELRFVREYISAHHEFAHEEPDAHQIEYMFLCRLADGALRAIEGTVPDSGTVPGLPSGTVPLLPDKGQLGLAWLPLATLTRYRLYPRTLRPFFLRLDDPAIPIYFGDVN